ncbi:N-acetylmuramic acid 6-phosphate etherase [Treponema sp.]
MIKTIIDQELLESFATESRNKKSENIDTLNTREILAIINDEDKTVPYAVERALDEIASLVDEVVASFRSGGKLVYIGAGTSGRLGVLDASECPPTYGTKPEMVQGLIAGGKEALVRSIENAEDRVEEGVADLSAIHFEKKDVLIGITASGQAPYVLGAMEHARSLGAVVAAISCNANSRTFEYAKHQILIEVGPEIVTGSTRMKAGTAQKLVLNMITTTAMVRIGKTYKNLMVDLSPVNRKLVERSKRLIRQATGCTLPEAEAAFEQAGRKPKLAILMVLLGVGRDRAAELEVKSLGRIAEALRLHKLDQEAE